MSEPGVFAAFVRVVADDLRFRNVRALLRAVAASMRGGRR